MILKFSFESKPLVFASVFVSVLQVVLSECGSRPCLRFCCPPGSVLIDDSMNVTCQKCDVSSVIPNSDRYQIVYEDNCLDGQFPTDIVGDEFDFSPDGDLVLSFNEQIIRKPPNEYCINYTNGSDFISLILCINLELDQPDAVYTGKPKSQTFHIFLFI